MTNLQTNLRIGFVNNNFTELKEHLFFCKEDPLVMEFLDVADLKGDALEAVENNIDFFTFFTFEGEKDLDLLFLLYIGKENDTGFLLYYFKDILLNKSNILPILQDIFLVQPQLDKSAIISSVSEEIVDSAENILAEHILCHQADGTLIFETKL